MKALRQYEHISATIYNDCREDEPLTIGDAILEEILKSVPRSLGRVSYIFAKKNGLSTEVPDENIINEEKEKVGT